MMEDPLIEKNNGLKDMSADDGGSFDIKENKEEEGLGDFINISLGFGGVDAQMISPPIVIGAAGTEGSDAFTTTLAQNKPHDEHPGLRQRRRTNVSYSEDDQHQETHIQNDDPLQLTLMTKRPSPMLDLNKFDDQPVQGSVGTNAFITPNELIDNPRDKVKDDLAEVKDDHAELDNLFAELNNLLLYNSWDEDEVSQMLSPLRTFLGAAGIEVPTEDDFINSSLDLGGVDVDSQMISPRRTVIAAEGTEVNKLMHGWDQHRIDIPGGNSNDERKGWDLEWIFVITNVVLQSMSAIFTQLSSKQKPQYALFGVLLSYLALLTCIIEIIYEGHQQIPIQRSTLSNNRTQRGKSFATLNNIVALACALGDCVVTTVNYRFDSPIKLTVLPIILANGVLFSKILKYRDRNNTSISFKKSQ